MLPLLGTENVFKSLPKTSLTKKKTKPTTPTKKAMTLSWAKMGLLWRQGAI